MVERGRLMQMGRKKGLENVFTNKSKNHTNFIRLTGHLANSKNLFPNHTKSSIAKYSLLG